MKEFIEKLIERLRELPTKGIDRYKGGAFGDYEGTDYFIDKHKTIDIINQLAEEYRNDKVCQTAIMYAENLYRYGIQVDSIWETATQQSMALNQAYLRGRQYERDRFAEWQEEHNNGWIPCSERLPETNKGVLVCTNEGQVDVDYYGEYVKDFIGLKGTEQYAIAWQPLPAPYKEGE